MILNLVRLTGEIPHNRCVCAQNWHAGPHGILLEKGADWLPEPSQQLTSPSATPVSLFLCLCGLVSLSPFGFDHSSLLPNEPSIS